MGSKEDSLRCEVLEQAHVFMRMAQEKVVTEDTKKKVGVSSGLRRSMGGNGVFRPRSSICLNA